MNAKFRDHNRCQNRVEIDQKCGLLWPAEFFPLLGGDLNPLSGFCFPPFSMSFPEEFPSGRKPRILVEGKLLLTCCTCTYKFFVCCSYFAPLFLRREPLA